VRRTHGATNRLAACVPDTVTRHGVPADAEHLAVNPLVRRHLVSTAHGYIHVRASGSGGVPLVLLHKGAGSERQFRRVLPFFAQTREALAVDRLGFGASDPAEGPLPTISDYGAVTLEALDQIGIDRFDVLGSHSGATEALALAVDHPERVRRLVLHSVPMFDEAERVAMLDRFPRSFTVSPDGSHLSTMWNRAKATGEGRYLDYHDPTQERGELDSPRAGWGTDILQDRVLQTLLAGEGWWWPYVGVFGFSVADALGRLTQPLLALNCNDDLWDITRRALDHLPEDARYTELPDLDIHAFELAPERMAAHVVEFLDDDD
jgi:pimeloyl-ACP methyl ester carboxylesterase